MDFFKEKYLRWETAVKADPLEMILLLTTYLGGVKIFRFFCLSAIVVHLVVTALQTFTMARNFDATVFIQQAPFYFGSFHCISSGMISLCSERDFLRLLQEFPPAVWLERDDALSRRIQKESKMAASCVVFSCVLTGLGCLAMYPPLCKKELYFFASFIAEHLPSLSPLCYLYYSSFAPLVFIMTLMAHCLFYITTYLKFQICVMNEYLEAVAGVYTNSDAHVALKDEEYQREVRQRLKKFVQDHVMLKRAIEETNQLLRVSMVIGIFTGSIFLLSAIFFLLTDKINLLTCLIIVEATLVAAIFFSAGQVLRNESDRTFSIAVDLPWLAWNVENRRMLLLCLTNMTKPMTLNVSNVIRTEYSYMLKFFRVIWSVIAVMWQLLSRRA